MGPNTNLKKKPPIDDWDVGIPIAEDEWDTGVPIAEDDWDTGVTISRGPDPLNIDDSGEAPISVRAAVGALDKPEDRLNALRKHYPDAQPYGDGNFIFTDPETGKTRMYNQEGWIPSVGDAVSALPELGEGLGGALGAIFGGAGGAALGGGSGAVAGSVVVPGPGTVAGGIGGAGYGGLLGALAGAGTGGTLGRETVRRGLNWMFDNEDTRTGSEQLKDAGTTFALNAAGEGVGRGLYAVGSAVVNGGKRLIGKPNFGRLAEEVGPADDVAKAAIRRDDLRAIGVEPTAGMVANTAKASTAEQALKATEQGKVIQSRIDDAFVKQKEEFDRIVTGVSPKALSKSEAGMALREQAEAMKTAAKAETDRLYGETKTLATAPATTNATADFMQKLQVERAGLGKWSAKTTGKQADEVLSHAADIVDEAKNSGWSFMQLKDARTDIAKMANDTDDTALKNHLNSLRDALTSDMDATANAAGPDAVKAWKAAEASYKDRISPDIGFGKGGQGYALTDKRIETDKLFDRAMSDKMKGGNKIAATRRMIEKDEGGKEVWRNTIAGEIDRMGRTSNGDFSGTQFLKEWGKFSPEAKNAAFSGTEYAGYRADLDRLARIADNMKKYSKSANHSNTQNHSSFLKKFTPAKLMGAAIGGLTDMVTTGGFGTMAAVKGAMIGAGVDVVTANGKKQSVNMLTSPETVKWLTEIPAQSMKKGGIQAHLARLKRSALRTPDTALRQSIMRYLADVGYDDDNNE